MKIIEDYQGCYSDALERYYNFDKLSKDGDKVLFHGMGCIEKETHKQAFSSYKKKAFLNLEQPCAWQGGERTKNISSNADGYFDKVHTICPYSAEWLNEQQNGNTFVPCYIPFSKQHVVNKKEDKKFDAIYWGGIHSEENFKIVNCIKDFKYNFLSLGTSYWSGNFRYSPAGSMITSHSVPRRVMWALLRQTKVCPMSNLLFLQDSQVDSIKSMKIGKAARLSSILDRRIMPQNKTRMIECAVNRTLILVKKNPWNLDEMWFTPEEDFLYFEDYDELPSLINDVSLKLAQV
jgi:hypothetical protein